MLRLLKKDAFIYLVTAPRKYKFFRSSNFNLKPYDTEDFCGLDRATLVLVTNSLLETDEIVRKAKEHNLEVKNEPGFPNSVRYEKYYQNPGSPPESFHKGYRITIYMRKSQIQNYKAWFKDLRENLGYFFVWYWDVKDINYYYIIK